MKLKVKEINLLPKEYIQAQRMKIYILMAVAAVFLECILFVLTVVLPPMRVIESQEQILLGLQEKANQSQYLEVNATMDHLKLSREEVQKWIDKYKAIKKPNFVSKAMLDELVARIPEGITIDSMEAKSIAEDGAADGAPSILIKGRTQTLKGILNYVAIVETLYKEAAVTFKIEDDTAESIYKKYEITMKLPVPQVVKTEEISEEVPAEGSEETTAPEETTSVQTDAVKGGTET